MRTDFYVYVLLDPRRVGRWSYPDWGFTIEPFYIGKGSGARARISSRGGRPSHLQSRIKAMRSLGVEPAILKLYEGMSEAAAFEREIEAIALIGRRLRGAGPLVNLQRGGSGFARRRPCPPTSDETREKIRRALTGRKLPEEVKAKLRGKSPWNKGRQISERQRLLLSRPKGPPYNKGVPMSAEKREKCAPTMFKPGRVQPENWKAITSAKLRGRAKSPETCQKISAAKKGKPQTKLKGRKRSAEVGAKISAAKKGKPNPKARGIPRPAHVIAAMQAGVARWRAEKRAA